MKTLCLILAAIVFLPLSASRSDEKADRKLRIEPPGGVEMAALQAAADSRFYVASIEAAPILRSLRAAYGVTPKPIRLNNSSVRSQPPSRDHRITAAIAVSSEVTPVWVVQLEPEPIHAGGDGTEKIDFQNLKLEDLGNCGRVPGTGKTRVGFGLFKHRTGRGYTGGGSPSFVVSHRDADFYEMHGPFEVSRLPFRITIPVPEEENAPDDARIEAIMVWFPRKFSPSEQKTDLEYKDLPDGSVVIAAVMNLKPAEKPSESDDQ